MAAKPIKDVVAVGKVREPPSLWRVASPAKTRHSPSTLSPEIHATKLWYLGNRSTPLRCRRLAQQRYSRKTLPQSDPRWPRPEIVRRGRDRAGRRHRRQPVLEERYAQELPETQLGDAGRRRGPLDRWKRGKSKPEFVGRGRREQTARGRQAGRREGIVGIFRVGERDCRARGERSAASTTRVWHESRRQI